jgi:hypothetical protein
LAASVIADELGSITGFSFHHFADVLPICFSLHDRAVIGT